MSLGDDLFTAATAARFCGVDLKTIHNWADRGKIPHYRTEGRHLRIHRVDLVAFLREYEMPLPRALARGTPRVALIADDPAALSRLRRALEDRFTVDPFGHAVDALLALGARLPQALVAVEPLAGVDLTEMIARLRAGERTAHVRVVAVAHGPIEGAVATVTPDRMTPVNVRAALSALTGLG